MGIHDRDYFREDSTYRAGHPPRGPHRASGGFQQAMRTSPVVFGLLFANIALFILQHLTRKAGIPAAGNSYVAEWLVLIPSRWFEAWRFLGFQFLHGDFSHLLFNMLGVYMFGRHLEALWGPKRFLRFYLLCGVLSGVAQVAFEYLAPGGNINASCLGASGGVSAILAAVAVLFPQIKVIMFPIFIPISIRIVVVIFFVISFFSFGSNDGTAHAAHLGGLIAGLLYTIYLPKFFHTRIQKTHEKNQTRWDEKIAQQAEFQKQVDSVLEKIQNRGIASLSQGDKDLLGEATRRQREEDERIRRL